MRKVVVCLCALVGFDPPSKCPCSDTQTQSQQRSLAYALPSVSAMDCWRQSRGSKETPVIALSRGVFPLALSLEGAPAIG